MRGAGGKEGEGKGKGTGKEGGALHFSPEVQGLDLRVNINEKETH